MSESLNHNCGIAAVYLQKQLSEYLLGGAASLLYKMLLRQQNRGQLSAGITTFNPSRQQLIDTYKKIGLVNEVFSTRVPAKFENILKDYAGVKGIGHVRYATFGADDEGYAQPFERHHNRKWKWFSFAFNGNIANYSGLKKELELKDYHFVRNSDTELLLLLIEAGLKGDEKTQLENVFNGISERIDGAYSLAYLNAEGELAVLRDPLGIKPLCYTENSEIIAAASESSALINDTETEIKSLKPGEILFINESGVEVKKFAKSKRTAHCMFEWVYFANPSSTIDEVNVYEARRRLGTELAKAESLEASSEDFIVVGVPDTAKPAADAFAHELGLPSMEGLTRNRYVGRTFIEGENRAKKAREKYSVIKSIIKGKKIFLIEDSIVRGTTCRELVNCIKESGAKEVHLRVSCPPIRFPCFYGIDMSSLEELIAANHSSEEERHNPKAVLSEKTIEKIRKETNADSLAYQSVEGLVKALKLPEESLCLACLNAGYPTPKGSELLEKCLACFGGQNSKRIYE